MSLPGTLESYSVKTSHRRGTQFLVRDSNEGGRASELACESLFSSSSPSRVASGTFGTFVWCFKIDTVVSHVLPHWVFQPDTEVSVQVVIILLVISFYGLQQALSLSLPPVLGAHHPAGFFLWTWPRPFLRASSGYKLISACAGGRPECREVVPRNSLTCVWWDWWLNTPWVGHWDQCFPVSPRSQLGFLLSCGLP